MATRSPRTYANFVALHKSLGAGVPDLPPKANFKARATADAESATATRAAALNTWLWEVAQAQPQLMHSSLAVLRFVDPYDKVIYLSSPALIRWAHVVLSLRFSDCGC